MNLPATSPDAPLHRLGRDDDAWAWPEWPYAGEDGTFGNRWDDPLSKYRVLYACSQRLGAFIETLARFRPDPHVIAGLAEIVDDEPDAEPVLAPGDVHPSWAWARRIGTATVEGSYAQVGHAAWLGYLTQALAARLIHFGIGELDGATLRSSAPRGLTQEISRHVIERANDDGTQAYDGICYASRLGDDFTNWAIFEPEEPSTWKLIVDAECEYIDTEDADFVEAMQLLGLRLNDLS